MACCRGSQTRAVSSWRKEAAAAEQHPERLRLQLHSAELLRSFCKVGWMNPYVVVSIDGHELHRTARATRAHKSPSWEDAVQLRAEALPCRVTIAVRSSNYMGKDVLCGSVTIPCTKDMAELRETSLELTKRSELTGTVRISLSLLSLQLEGELGCKGTLQYSSDSAPTLLSPKRSCFKAPPSQQTAVSPPDEPLEPAPLPQLIFRQPTVPKDDEQPEWPDEYKEEAMATAETTKEEAMATAETTKAASPKALAGNWKCVDTFGLEEFLKATGVSWIERKAAMAARWPAWEFGDAEAGRVHFVNHSAMGDLKENVILDEPSYQHKDGRGNALTCSARWEQTADGGVLTISRKGGMGSFSEVRRVEGNTLSFVLTSEDGFSWGRTFQRA